MNKQMAKTQINESNQQIALIKKMVITKIKSFINNFRIILYSYELLIGTCN